MHIIYFNSKQGHVYNSKTKTFTMSERGIPFDTNYKIFNPATGKSAEFEFKESTGPQFHKDTQWIYKSKPELGLTLAICNDAQMAKIAGDAYLKHKTGR